MAHPADELGDLEARQLAALAGLGALGHLDLDLAALVQVFGGDAEAARGHLLDRRVGVVAVGARRIASRVLAALAGHSARAHPVHGDVQGLMGLRRQGAERHGLGQEAAADVRDALDLVQLDRGQTVLEVQQVAQGKVRLFANGFGILLEALVVAAVHRVLQKVDGLRVMGVGLAARADAEETAHGRGGNRRAEGCAVTLERSLLQTGQTDAGDARRRAGEELSGQGARQAQDLEFAAAAIGGDDADALARQHLEQAGLYAVLVVQAGVMKRQARIGAAI